MMMGVSGEAMGWAETCTGPAPGTLTTPRVTRTITTPKPSPACHSPPRPRAGTTRPPAMTAPEEPSVSRPWSAGWWLTGRTLVRAATSRPHGAVIVADEPQPLGRAAGTRTRVGCPGTSLTGHVATTRTPRPVVVVDEPQPLRGTPVPRATVARTTTTVSSTGRGCHVPQDASDQDHTALTARQ